MLMAQDILYERKRFLGSAVKQLGPNIDPVGVI